jgi:superoxide dismutase
MLPTSDPGAATGSSGMYGSTEAPAALDALGRTLYPLFCVSVHEHAWMVAGYGVWGMETYLERFWTCLDWAAVRDAYAQYAFRK